MEQKDKEMAELLSCTYQRQYHHNTYPELSDNSEFVTSKEEIKNACMEMAAWKEQQMIEKTVKWIEEHYQEYDEIGINYFGQLITDDFKKSMEE